MAYATLTTKKRAPTVPQSEREELLAVKKTAKTVPQVPTVTTAPRLTVEQLRQAMTGTRPDVDVVSMAAPKSPFAGDSEKERVAPIRAFKEQQLEKGPSTPTLPTVPGLTTETKGGTLPGGTTVPTGTTTQPTKTETKTEATPERTAGVGTGEQIGGTGEGTGGTGDVISGGLRDIIDTRKGLVNEVRNQPNYQALYLALTEQILASIDQAEARIREMFERQMGTVDPLTQATLAQLREEFQRGRESLLNDLNRRGLLQSGIALQYAERLRKDELSAEERVLAQRMRTLQDQLNTALLGLAQQRLSARQQMGLAAIQAAERQALARQQALGQAIQTGLGILGYEQQRRAQEAGLTGYYGGQPTLARQQFEWQMSQPATVDLNQQLRDSALIKLSQGVAFEQLTPAEQIAVGVRPSSPPTEQEIRTRALQLAQSDPRWQMIGLPQEEREAIIREYEGYLRGTVQTAPQQSATGAQPQPQPQATTPTPGVPPADVALAVQQLQTAGFSQDEIADFLQRMGIDARYYLPNWRPQAVGPQGGRY